MSVRLVSLTPITTLLLASPDASALEWDHTQEFEVGYQGSVLTKDGTVTRNRPYGSAKHQTSAFSETSPTRWSFDANLRAWLDLGEEFEIDGEYDLRQLSVSRADDHTEIQLGFQEIAWGETFGFPIADIVNPRDLRDPYFFEMDWIRRATMSANVQLILGDLRLQAVATPYPRNNVLPERGSAFDPFPPILDGIPLGEQRSYPIDRFGQDGEYGGRASYFFPIGLDVALFYFYHWNRTPVVELQVVNGGFVLVPIQEQIHSAGLTFSKAFDEWVIRADTVVHLDEPAIADNLGPSDRITHVQSIIGADVTTESDWMFGVQGHYDHRGDEGLQWVSAQVRKLLFNGQLEPQIFGFVGLDNTDRWLQPRIDWHVIDAWTVSLRGDFVWGSTDEDAGDLGFYDKRHRVMLWTQLRL